MNARKTYSIRGLRTQYVLSFEASSEDAAVDKAERFAAGWGESVSLYEGVAGVDGEMISVVSPFALAERSGS